MTACCGRERERSSSRFSRPRPHDIFSKDPRRARSWHPHRAVFRRARGGAEMGGRRFRQAAPDDGVALHHRFDHRQSRVASGLRSPDAGPASRGRDWRSVAPGAFVRLPHSPDVSCGSKRVILQFEPRRAASRLQLHRPVHSREPIQFPGEQHRASRGPLLRHSGHRPVRHRTQGAFARRSAGRQRRDLGGHSLRDSPDALRTVCDCRQCGGDAESGAVEPSAGLPGGVRRCGSHGQSVGAPGTGRRAHPHSSQGCPRRVARRAHHRVHRRRSLHRAAGPHRSQPQTAWSTQRRRAGAGPADGGYRAGLLQPKPRTSTSRCPRACSSRART